jgi:hypothetical protein
MAWYPGAQRQQLPRNFGPGRLNPIQVTLHHQAGSGNPYNVYLSRGVSAHFWIAKDGRVIQHVDTNMVAWHGVAHNQYGIGVETEGCGAPPHAEPLTAKQLDAFAKLMQWANRTHGIPLVLSEAVNQKGLSYHRARGGPATGCPCAVRVNQRAEILRRAKGSGGPAAAKPSGTRWVADGTKSLAQIASARNTRVATIVGRSISRAKEHSGRALNDGNRDKLAMYLAGPQGANAKMPKGLVYWTVN